MTSQPPGQGAGSYGPPGQSGGGQAGWGQQPYGGGQQPGYQAYPYQQPSGQYGYRPQQSFGAAQSGVSQYGGQYGAPQALRPRNPLMPVLLGMIALVILALAGLVVANLVGGSNNVAYQNDDYQVPAADKNPPAIPRPTTYAEAEKWVTNNALYGQSVPVPVRCNSQPVDLLKADDAELETHFNGLMECLVRVWQPPLTAAGFQIFRPTVTIYGKEITTRCGRSGVNAFYCSLDQQVYFSNLLGRANETVGSTKWGGDLVMAHEFGHVIQGRIGVAASGYALADNAGSEAESNLVIRRVETQADCFSGQFLRSTSQSLGIQQDDVPAILDAYSALGDDSITGRPDIDASHGLATTRRYWGAMGLSNDAIGKCNTFTVAKNLVR